MATYPRSARWSLIRGIAVLSCGGVFGSLTSPVLAQGNQLDVGVRSAVVDRSFDASMMTEAGRHGKSYGILAVQLITSDQKIVKPVDARELMELVCHELDAHGFSQVAKGGKPDILITVQYGRAWLRNPYFGATQTNRATGIAGRPSPDGGMTASRDLTMGDASTFARLREPGIEAKAQKAEAEKLCIKLTAWEYLTDPKAKAHQVWNTTMVVDDPDHRDLNLIAAEMLAAGSAYFGREIKEEELDVYRPLPDGHVNVGTPTVVDRSKVKLLEFMASVPGP